MLRLIFLMTCLAGQAVANEYPPVPEGGLIVLQVIDCTDGETGEKGTCQTYQGIDGTVYVTFWQGDVMMFVRKVVDNGYETVWVNDQFMSI